MLVLGQTACKETAPPVLVPAQPTYAEDSAAIIRLEDLRVLRDAPDSPRDLTAIAKRTDPNLRRRAAFAIGRVGDVAGRPALEALLGDPEPARAAVGRVRARAARRQGGGAGAAHRR